ncbi:hypothetical protein GIB67_015782 [Kingdonia uniflora]|uniref:histidine kinase n=1 Tax=Kingdonia uniflora TaxID=39325 RepID=A0A7J7NUU8_9MAGN|nr:hypothetical protein GIB67_015782 [Kingdonia uniflora]
MLAILIGMLTILTWHFTRVYTTKSINSLAYGLRYELLQRPILRMWNILNSTVEITMAQVKLSEYVIRRYDKPMAQTAKGEVYEVMRDVTWALFASRKALNAITISYRNGFVQAFHRDHRSNNTFYIYSDFANTSLTATRKSVSSHGGWNDQSLDDNVSAIWYREPLDPVTGKTTGNSKKIPPDDLIDIAGLSEVADGTASWHVTVSKYTNSPLLSAALPVWDSPNESIVAVVGVTTALYSVGQLMKELVDFHSGFMYLTSQEGYVLATSTNAPLLRNLSSGPKLMMAVDSEDHMIRLGARWLKRTYDDKFNPRNEIHAENVRLGKHQYYIDSFFLNLKRLPLVGVIIIPRSYVMGKVDQRAFTTLVILISASVCILVVGCVCILILTSGVSKEMKLRAELISHLDARRRAEASSNFKSQFLANMSHELRTPMAAVLGLLDILICDDCLSNEQYATVTQIRKCSTALLRLLNNILDLSKVESGKLVLEEAEFDLGRELEGLVDMFSVQCINHNVETVLDFSDDMPKLVLGDSARVVQIFANLISNSMKFTSSGHIILRGWCESSNTGTYTNKFPLDQKEPRSAVKAKSNQHGNHGKKTTKKDNKIVIWFEVDDSGCGIDASKWESVFESFEQADPSTTRTHGGTGLGLCIVRTLVNQMNGEIKVVKKDGPGTLMQLYLVLNTPVDALRQNDQVLFAEHNLTVLLSLNGTKGRSIMSCWLRKNGVQTFEASEWNELTQILQEILQGRNTIAKSSFKMQCSAIESSKAGEIEIGNLAAEFIIIVDIGLLDSSTNIWKEQLKFLEKYLGKAKFAWILNHDTNNAIKLELRRKGHSMVVNKPLYKAKMVQILEAVINERSLELHKNGLSTIQDNLHDSLEIPFNYDAASSEESDTSDGRGFNSISAFHVEPKLVERIMSPQSSRFNEVNNSLVELSVRPTSQNLPLKMVSSDRKEQNHVESCKVGPMKNSLEGLRILLAEDTPVLQKVATIMLEKLGAMVSAVGDGLQAVEALKYMSTAEEGRRRKLPMRDDETISPTHFHELPAFDLILMDCQVGKSLSFDASREMPKMDGYEATKAIRRFEEGTESHIPIVALTAHAMSSDEAKCLEVGMDAYLTKPIDCKLMLSTILVLTKRVL